MKREETISHLFMRCDRAAHVWFGSNLGVNFTPNHSYFLEWLFYCITSLNEEDLVAISAIIYGIWWARNKLVFDNYDMEDKAIIDQAYSSIKDYQQMNNHELYKKDIINKRSSNYNNRYRNNKPLKWSKPRVGRIKANSDANLSIEGWWGLGAIFRDDSGDILASATWRVPGLNDPSTTEACALFFTVLLAIDCCFHNVDFEVDCSTVADRVNKVVPNPRSYLGNYFRVIFEHRAIVHNNSVSQISRKANSVAHGLSLLAHSEPNCIWMEDTHPQIVPLVFKDLF
jgi:hypothetical protein